MILDRKSEKQKQTINFHLKFSFNILSYTSYDIQTPNLEVRVLQAHLQLYLSLFLPVNPTYWITTQGSSHLCTFAFAVLSRYPSSPLMAFKSLSFPLSPLQLLSPSFQLFCNLWLWKPHSHFVPLIWCIEYFASDYCYLWYYKLLEKRGNPSSFFIS